LLRKYIPDSFINEAKDGTLTLNVLLKKEEIKELVKSG